MTDEARRWFAGVDWGSEKHQVCLLDEAGAVVGERAFRHDGAGLAALCDWLVSLAGGARAVAVAIEVPHGPVVDALLDRGFAVHAINPKQLDRLRDRISVAGAKDDRIRQQLWRYYPQLLELSEDVTPEWILELWAVAPTPAKATRLREATVARLLGRHRIRRLDAASVLEVLRQPAITAAAGVTEAAVLHLRSLVARLRL